MHIPTIRVITRIVVGLSIVLGLTTPAAAQDAPKADVAISYSILNDSDIEETLTKGWVAALTVHLNDRFAIVGEAGANYKTMEAFGIDFDLSVKSYLAGARISGRRGRVTPFGQVLFGVARAGASVEGASESLNAFAIQPGGGFDIALGSRAALRVQGDYRAVRDEGETTNEIRFAVGVAFGFGSR